MENLTDHDLLLKHNGKIDELCEIIKLNNEEAIRFHKKFECFISPEGTFMTVKTFQASCPREDVWRTINRQWKAIGMLVVTMFGMALKIFWKD